MHVHVHLRAQTDRVSGVGTALVSEGQRVCARCALVEPASIVGQPHSVASGSSGAARGEESD